MIQLSFQPALDPLHATFRLLRLREAILNINGCLPWETIRIIDFFLTFPYKIADIRLSQQDRALKKIALRYLDSKGYARLPDDLSLFNRMEPMQTAALQNLLRAGLLKREHPERGEICSTEASLTPALKTRVDTLNDEQSDLMGALTTLTAHYPLLGTNGLKDRTRLMDHRYDATA